MTKPFYVYEYWRDDLQEPVYVGKGSGDRAWEHLRKARRGGEVTQLALCLLLQELIQAGYDPQPRIVARFTNERDAYQEESRRIRAYGTALSGRGTLLNNGTGHEFGRIAPFKGLKKWAERKGDDPRLAAALRNAYEVFSKRGLVSVEDIRHLIPPVKRR